MRISDWSSDVCSSDLSSSISQSGSPRSSRGRTASRARRRLRYRRAIAPASVVRSRERRPSADRRSTVGCVFRTESANSVSLQQNRSISSESMVTPALMPIFPIQDHTEQEDEQLGDRPNALERERQSPPEN